jgi:hypothetical protein
MKGLAALGAAALIAAAVGLWFMTKPAVVAMEVTPLTPSSALPSFKPITDDHRFGPVPQNAK